MMPSNPLQNQKNTELMKFPCAYPLKVFGLNSFDFEQTVVNVIRAHCQESEAFQISKNESKRGKYQSLTITFTAASRQHLDRIYQSLTDCEQVVMAL